MAMVGQARLRRAAGLLGHRLAPALYVLFALFPLYWLVQHRGHARTSCSTARAPASGHRS
jgi:hypothetical protein